MLLGETVKLETPFESLINSDLLRLIKQCLLDLTQEDNLVVMKFDQLSTLNNMSGMVMVTKFFNPEVYSSEGLLTRRAKGHPIYNFTLDLHTINESDDFYSMDILTPLVSTQTFTRTDPKFNHVQSFFIFAKENLFHFTWWITGEREKKQI